MPEAMYQKAEALSISPVFSDNPKRRFMQCTALPAPPLRRLSIAEIILSGVWPWVDDERGSGVMVPRSSGEEGSVTYKRHLFVFATSVASGRRVMRYVKEWSEYASSISLRVCSTDT